MSIDICEAPAVSTSSRLETGEDRIAPMDVTTSYDGSNVVFRLLRLSDWGPGLMNLGYYRFRGPLGFLNVAKLAAAQRRLVRKAVELLEVQRGHSVLDVACGRGESSFILRCMHSESTIVGLDLLEQNVQVARTLFSDAGNLSYQTGNAMNLDASPGSYDRVMCIEAAFHFPDRAQFLREAYRVLRPGGRLVVVDFAWNTDADRAHRDDPETRLVRSVWQWNDFFSVAQYERAACAAGFRVASRCDWSRRVTHRIQALFDMVSLLGKTRLGRQLLYWFYPLYRSLSKRDWEQIDVAVPAHRHVHRYSKYMAFVFEK